METVTTDTATRTEQPPTTLGERIRAARHERGLSQSQLAGAELTKGFISQVESGLVRPSLRSLQLLATRLGKSLDYFLGDETLAAEKRVAFHQLAARAAAERRDWQTVRAEVTLAMEQTPTAKAQVVLLDLLAAADIAEGRYESAFARITEALEVADPRTDGGAIASLHFHRGLAYGELGQLVVATEEFERASAALEQHEIVDPRLRARILVSLGTTYVRLNRTARATATYESALAIATRSSEMELAGRSYMGLARALYDGQEYEAAIASYQHALALFERLADTDFELNALQSLAGVHFERGDLAQARELALRCETRATAAGDRRWAAVARVEQARVLVAEGKADEALSLANAAEIELAEARDALQRAAALRVMGAAYELKGDPTAADARYLLAIDVAGSVEHLATRSNIARAYAHTLRARGDLERAYEMLELAGESAAKR